MLPLERRVRGEHVEYDLPYYYAYSAEIEIGAMCMWSMVIACDSVNVCRRLFSAQNLSTPCDAQEISIVESVIRHLCKTLGQWFDAIGFDDRSAANVSDSTVQLRPNILRTYRCHALNSLFTCRCIVFLPLSSFSTVNCSL